MRKWLFTLHLYAALVAGLFVIVLFLLVSGLYLWWPQKRASIRWSGPAFRVWWDLHNTVGVLSIVFLLLLTITGVAIGFERVTVPFFYRITGSAPMPTSFVPSP